MYINNRETNPWIGINYKKCGINNTKNLELNVFDYSLMDYITNMIG